MASARDLPPIWFLAPFAAIPLPAWIVGLGIAGLVTGAYVGMELVFDALGRHGKGESFWTRGDLRHVIPGALLLGYIPAGVVYGTRSAGRAWREIRPLVRNPDAQLETLMAQHPSLTRRSFRLAGLAGALTWIVSMPILAGVSFASALHLHHWTHYNWFSFAVNLGLFVMFAQVIYASVGASAGAPLAMRLEWDLDLLDPGALRPLVRQGLSHALLWVVGISIVSLAFLDPAGEPGDDLLFQGAVLAVAFAGALAALILPLRNAHRLIAALKAWELNCLHAAIRGDRASLAGTALADQASKLSLADLVAYRDRIASVHEWPIERSTILRIVLFLGIPIGSWIGGALVERPLGILLD
jgi:hypothetical protein